MISVLRAGRGDHHGQQQPDYVHGDVPLAARHLFARIKPAGIARHPMPSLAR